MVAYWKYKMDRSKKLVRLHPDAKITSFEHKHFILQIFKKNIQGILGIDYFSLMIVDRKNTISIYSSCPSLEFNLINDNLWKEDGIFNSVNHQDHAFFFWDELYSPIFKKILIKEKEKKYAFNLGFCVMKQLSDVFVIYSFATKSQHHKQLYRHSKDTLSKIGDYFFNKLKNIHHQYVTRDSKESFTTKTSLKLVVDNTKLKN